EAGLEVAPIADAVRGAQVVAMLVPDHVQQGVWEEEVAPSLEPGAAVLFAHGLNIHFGRITPPEGHDVLMVAPKAPGHRVRELFVSGAGTPGLVAIHQDASGRALPLALAYGVGIGCGRVGLLETTFAEETESDLFGEQAVLCGGVPALVQAGFDTLVEAGYQPEIAYYECLNELKLIVDLLYQGGYEYMRYSVSDVADRTRARAMVTGIGLDAEAPARPLVGIATTWIETMPCNWNQRELARHVRRGILEAGGTPVEFNTIAVSDGVSMGTEGMRASLVSREVIADSIELVVRGHLLDGLVCLGGCDKTIPAAVMALARLDVPGLVLYNGSIAPGRFRGRDVTIQDVFEAVGAAAAGTMSPEDVHELESAACPGAGACGAQFTANTMAMVLEFLGISPAGLNDVPATDPAKTEAAYEAGRIAMQLVRDDVRPSQLITRDSIENAIAAVAASGGSTNGVLHLLAIARELDIPLELEDFDRIAER